MSTSTQKSQMENSLTTPFPVPGPRPENRDEPGIRIVRFTISADALLPVSEAARVLHGRESKNREWIVDNVDAIYAPSGKALYLWGDIVRALRDGGLQQRRAA